MAQLLRANHPQTKSLTDNAGMMNKLGVEGLKLESARFGLVTKNGKICVFQYLHFENWSSNPIMRDPEESTFSVFCPAGHEMHREDDIQGRGGYVAKWYCQYQQCPLCCPPYKYTSGIKDMANASKKDLTDDEKERDFEAFHNEWFELFMKNGGFMALVICKACKKPMCNGYFSRGGSSKSFSSKTRARGIYLSCFRAPKTGFQESAPCAGVDIPFERAGPIRGDGSKNDNDFVLEKDEDGEPVLALNLAKYHILDPSDVSFFGGDLMAMMQTMADLGIFEINMCHQTKPTACSFLPVFKLKKKVNVFYSIFFGC